MSKLKLFFFGLAVVMVVPSCFIDVDDDDGFFGCVNGSGPVVEQTIDLPDFTGVELSMSGSVFIKQGPVQEVVIEAQQNIIDEIERDVRNGVWEIETDGCVRDVNTFRVFITMPDISFLKISGSGEMVSENVLQVGDIEMNVSGSGDMDIALEADDIQSKISGSGAIRMEGIADEIDLEISGSGDYRAFNLESRIAFVEIRGSGDAEVFVTDELNVKISGSGDVRYKGNPSLNVEISGSGEVIDAN